MSTTNRGKHVIAALALLNECGELTAQEFADYVEIGRYDAHAVLRRMAKRTKAGLKRAYVVRYIMDHDGARDYPRPVYALGDQPDAAKPKADPKAVKRRYEQRVRQRNTANSVFNLARPRREYRL